MEGEYELFERRADGVLSWRGSVQGLNAARLQVRLLAVDTGNECFALQPAERRVVAHAAPASRAGALEVPAAA